MKGESKDVGVARAGGYRGKCVVTVLSCNLKLLDFCCMGNGWASGWKICVLVCTHALYRFPFIFDLIVSRTVSGWFVCPKAKMLMW